ncbi:hypothetical protein [Cryobacterium arcticum]|uniref:ABC3 transporter permease protein domain-containing protein n=1 Tax=Cryobacterium arcticum TaxID=670052 RepID=A0A317ZMS9_9MICO|nr:hypothetical protein [Cryobacterium arcticum]PXA67188.1 hypothetical protein CTB96_10525 [Cryobacterium arcticum]
MSTLAIAVLRLRAALPALLALALIVVVAVLALGSTAGLIQHGVADGARVTLANAAAQSAAMRVTTHLAEDSAGQDAAATGLFDRLLPAGSVTVSRSQVSLAVPVLAGGGATAGTTAVFARVPDLVDRVEVTDGTWPPSDQTGTSPESRPVAVQADAAADLGLTVGDELTVGTAATALPFRVTALWRATDPTAPAWFADSAATAGRSGGASGWFVVQDGLDLLPTQHFAVWTLSATPAAADDENRAAVIAALHRLNDTLDATPNITESSSSIEGRLAGTLQRIENAGRGATAIGISAVFIVGMLGIVALLQVSTVLVGSRREHSALLRARGLAWGQTALLAIGEGLLVTIPASLVGLAATGLVVGLVTGTEPLEAAVAAAPFALGVCLIGVALLAVTVLSEPAGTAVTGRRSLATFAVSFGIVGVAATLATWQLHTLGSPVPPGAGGADLVAATSPALLLITLAALGTLLFVVLTPRLAARAARRGSVVTLLADAQLGARATRYLVPILAIAITLAAAAFATGIASTWQSAQVQAQLVGTGPTIGIALRSDGTAPADTEPVTAARFSDLRGVTGASAALVTTVRVGADSVPFVSLRPDAATALLGGAGDDLATALRSTTPAETGLDLPSGATGVQAAVSFGDTQPTATFALSIWAADADGSLARIPLTAGPGVDPADPDAASGLYSGVLPVGTAPWRLLAVQAERSGTPDRAVPTLTAGEFAAIVDGTATALADSAPVSLDIAAALPRSRAPIAATAQAGPLPVVLTAALADRVNLAVGDPLDIGFGASGSTLDAQVAAIVTALPGAASRLGIGTDLAALNDATLRQDRTPVLAGNVWIDTDDPDAVSTAASTVAASTAVISSQRTTTSAPMLQPAMNAFWIAAAAAGLLALITLAAFIADDARSRRTSLPVLRALGVSARQQTRARARELLLMLGFAAGVGIVAGLGSTLVAVTPFVAAAIPGAGGYVSVLPALAPLPWLGFSVGLLAGALLVIGGSLRRLRQTPTAVRS